MSKPIISANGSTLNEVFDTSDILSSLPSVPLKIQVMDYHHEELCNLNRINFKLPGVSQLSCSDDSGVSFLDTSNSSNEDCSSENFKADLSRGIYSSNDPYFIPMTDGTCGENFCY